MRKTILTILGAALMAASTATMAAASEHHHARLANRAPASEQFRNASNSLQRTAQPDWYSDYTEGHVISAPAGH
jgi:hypothetical protein